MNKFKYGKDCVCGNTVACRGLTAAFSLLGNDPRSGFVRLPNYKENPTTQYYVERNQQREVYLRYLLPSNSSSDSNPTIENTSMNVVSSSPTTAPLAKDVALHHFHPRIVARLVSKLQRQIPKTISETELQQLGVQVDPKDRILDPETGKPTGRCIFAPSYPIESAKEDLKRLLRLCQALNEAKEKDSSPTKRSKDTKKSSSTSSSSSPKSKKRKKKKFLADIRNEGDDLVERRGRRSSSSSSSLDDGEDERAAPSSVGDAASNTSADAAGQGHGDDLVVVDSLAEHNIESLLFHNIRLEPILEDAMDDDSDNGFSVEGDEKATPFKANWQEMESVSSMEEHEEEAVLPIADQQGLNDMESRQVTKHNDEQDNLNVDTLPTVDTDLDSVSSSIDDNNDDEAESLTSSTRNTATVSMQVRLEKLHTGKGKKRMSKVMKKPPSPFFEISILQSEKLESERKSIYRSYPLTDTKNATWDPIQDLQVEHVYTPQDLSFCITVYDCDTKAGNHLLIGTSQVDAFDLLITSFMSVPVLREEKVKGFLEISNFQLVTASTAIAITPNSDDEGSSVDSTREQQTDGHINDGDGEGDVEISDELVPEPTVTAPHDGSKLSTDESPAKTAETQLSADASPPDRSATSTSQDLNAYSSSPGIYGEEEAQSSSTHGDACSSFETDLSSVSALSMPSVTMQVSLEDLHTGKGKRKSLAGKVLHNKGTPSPFFDFAVLQEDELSSPTWQTLYQSYPLMETKRGTWDVVHDLSLGVLVKSTDDLSFRITVHDCDQKSGKHTLIGEAHVKSSALAVRSPRSIAIERGGKVKGRLRFDRFEMDWSA